MCYNSVNLGKEFHMTNRKDINLENTTNEETDISCYLKNNEEQIRKSIKQIEQGKVVVKTLEELEAIEN